MNETEGTTGPIIVVGVDGGPDSVRAVRYAVSEATRNDAGLRLVHVVPEAVPLAPMLPLVGTDSLRGVGNRILSDMADLAHEVGDAELHVEEVLAHGPRTHALLAYANDAAEIVLGRRASALEHIRTGSTTYAVAGRARCPVFAVPAEWEEATVHGRVVVGVDGSPASEDVVGAGFAAARARGAELVVLHAWYPTLAYEPMFGGRVVEAWERQTEPGVWAIVAGWRGDFPEVEVRVELRYEHPATALVEAGREADLLVLGRRGEGGLLGLAMGSKSRTLLRSGVCPVEIVPIPRPEPIELPRQTTRERAEARRSSTSGWRARTRRG